MKAGKLIWMPQSANVMKLKILVNVLCGNSGHRRKKVTINKVTGKFYCENLEEDVRDFVQNGIHCIITNMRERTPRPLSTALHGKRPNEVVDIDFPYIGAGK